MKKKLAIYFLCLTLGILLCACNSSSQLKNLSAYKWNLEFITDLDGKMLVSNVGKNDDTDTEENQLTLVFGEKTFTFTDKTNNKEWTGSYTLEKISDSYKVDLSLL